MKTIFQLRERCWPGYKPTPGKKAYAKGSCVKETITLPSDAPSIQSIAKKHGVSEEEIQKQLEMGLKVEQEHTSDVQAATEIALDHLNEKPDYYTRLKKFVEDIDGTTEQVAGSAQSTLTDKPNREPMKTYKQKNITELSTNLLDRYKEKAAADSAKADKEGNTAKADKRFSGVVKATTKQFDNFKKKGFSEEDITKKPEGFKALKPKESEHETYYKFIAGKAKLGKPLSTKERSFAQSYKMAREETEQIAEISKETVKKAMYKAHDKSLESQKSGDYKTANKKLNQAERLETKYKMKEEVEQIDEISAQAHKEYQAAARKDVAALSKHTGGEYGDIAKNIVNRRMKGLSTSTALQHRDTMMKVKKEEVEQIDEKNVPTSPEKWAQAKSQAKAKFDVYPSAYANGWAAKKYKAMGGGWKSVSEAVKDKFDIGEYDQEGDMAKSDLRSIMANSKKLHDMIEDADNLPEWCQNKITLAEDYISTVANYLTAEMNEEVEEIDETPKVDQGLSGKQKVAARAERGDNSPGFKIGNTTGGTWRGKDSPSPYKDSNVAKSGERKGLITKSAIQKTKEQIKTRLAKEEVEQIDELSKSTLGSYVKKASTNARINSMISKDFDHKATTARKPSTRDAYYGLSSKHKQKSWKRSDNVAKAVDRLTKEEVELEEVEELDEDKYDRMLSSMLKGKSGERLLKKHSDEVKKTKDIESGKTLNKLVKKNPGVLKTHSAAVKRDKKIYGEEVELEEAKEDLPFTPDKPKKQSVVAGKYGKEYSTARHLARKAMQKQVEKMKKAPIKEESRKAAIVKDIMKKKKGSEDAFQKEPELSSTLTKVQ